MSLIQIGLEIVGLIQNLFTVVLNLFISTITKGWELLKQLFSFLKPLSFFDYWTLILVIVDSFIPNKITDDRTNRADHLIAALVKAPQDNFFTIQFKGVFLKSLWDFVEKPFHDVRQPQGHKVDAALEGPRSYKWRLYDGRGNSVLNKYYTVGMGLTYYNNEVKGKGKLNNPPDPAAIFELAMKRTKFIPHPNGINVLLFYLAGVITHDLFWTSEKPEYQRLVNTSSSYLDLQPLYGRSKEEADAIRTFKNGLIMPDYFTNWRLSYQLPGIAVLVVLFSRNHNFIAQKLLQLNEDGRFTPENYSEAYLDEKLYQTARLINCGCYMNLIKHDYLKSILGIPTSSDFMLDPAQDPPALDPTTGNQTSLSFNFLYRWHSTVNYEDESLLEDIANQRKALLLSGAPPPGPKDMALGLGIQTLKRTSTGQFADSDLAGVLRRSIRQIAGHPGAQNIPAVFKEFEMDAIQQGRNLPNFPTLNEYRAHYKLKTYSKFEDLNPNPKVATALKKLYKSVNDVELYPGLVTEQTQDPESGGANTGIGLPYTVVTGILADAVNLVRNDRFLSTDWTPDRVTKWGYDFATDPAKVGLVSNNGSIMAHLLTNLLSRQFSPGEAIVKEPFRVPK